MRSRIQLARFGRCALAPVVVGAIALTACSSSGGSHPSSPGPRSGASSGVSGAPSASGSPADAATTSAVTRAYEVFFSNNSTEAQSQAVLQHGASFVKALAEQGNSSYADKSSAKVTSVSLVGPSVADVVFTITSNGKPMLQNSHGKAVRSGRTWQVAAVTFCGLLTLEGDAPSACKDPKITALPD